MAKKIFGESPIDPKRARGLESLLGETDDTSGEQEKNTSTSEKKYTKKMKEHKKPKIKILDTSIIEGQGWEDEKLSIIGVKIPGPLYDKLRLIKLIEHQTITSLIQTSIAHLVREYEDSNGELVWPSFLKREENDDD
jgi:hypothetical protein